VNEPVWHRLIAGARHRLLACATRVAGDTALLLLQQAAYHAFLEHRYALLNDPPLQHASKPGSVCANNRASYDDLTDLLTRAWPSGGSQSRLLIVRPSAAACKPC